jgi:hypothetical protein
VGKVAKRGRRNSERERHRLADELSLASRAQQVWDRRWDDAVETVFTALEVAKIRLKRIGPNEIMKLRTRLRATKTWPAHCWAPATLVAQVLMMDVAEPARSMFADVVMSTTQQLAAWRNAPLVVRFDPDIAAALLDTPLHREVPRDLLRRSASADDPLTLAGPREQPRRHHVGEVARKQLRLRVVGFRDEHRP